MGQRRLIVAALALVLAACELLGSAEVAAAPTGSAPATATDAQLEALHRLNEIRDRAGLAPVDQLHSLNHAASSHVQYLLANADLYSQGLSPHEQAEDRKGFLGRDHRERAANAGYAGVAFSEVIAFERTPAEAVLRWTNTLYHRLPLLHPAASHIGYAQGSDDRSRVAVLDLGAGSDPLRRSRTGILWPADGAIDVPAAWDGLETPRPPAPASGYPSGPVVTLVFGQHSAVTVLQHDLEVLASGAAVPHVLLVPADDPLLEHYGAVALYADDPLEPGVAYGVRLAGLAAGSAWSRTATFTTRAE